METIFGMFRLNNDVKRGVLQKMAKITDQSNNTNFIIDGRFGLGLQRRICIHEPIP